MLRFGVSDTSLSLSVFSASVDPCPGMSGVAVGGSIGLAESGQGATGQAATPPCAFVDFLVPVAAVWIQLDEAPGGVNCGARFQRFDPSTSTFVTVASLTPSATDGGVLVDIAQLEAAHGGAASADLRSYLRPARGRGCSADQDLQTVLANNGFGTGGRGCDQAAVGGSDRPARCVGRTGKPWRPCGKRRVAND
jgi:hypothetical protein